MTAEERLREAASAVLFDEAGNHDGPSDEIRASAVAIDRALNYTELVNAALALLECDDTTTSRKQREARDRLRTALAGLEER